MASTTYFTPATFKFLKDLAANNNRDWFNDNKARYEDKVKEPALRFISDFAPHLKKISPHFRADPRPNGGSLFRIYRDTRFSKDKTPYKTHTGIHFRHEAAKDAHAPGFYLHLEPGNVLMGAGCWHPARDALESIRDAIAGRPERWFEARDAVAGRDFEFEGDSLKRPPRGYPADHPAIEDLKRKDFIGVTHLADKDVTGPGFDAALAGTFRALAPLVRWLCEATGAEF